MTLELVSLNDIKTQSHWAIKWQETGELGIYRNPTDGCYLIALRSQHGPYPHNKWAIDMTAARRIRDRYQEDGYQLYDALSTNGYGA